jgi:hypothetical protein
MTTVEQDPGAALAQQILDAIKDHPNAEVRVNPNVFSAIPPNIASNLLEFLRRVESKGMEAVAWVECYQFVQQHVPQQGVPFGGLPPK